MKKGRRARRTFLFLCSSSSRPSSLLQLSAQKGVYAVAPTEALTPFSPAWEKQARPVVKCANFLRRAFLIGEVTKCATLSGLSRDLGSFTRRGAGAYGGL